jgi:chaperonin GroES
VGNGRILKDGNVSVLEVAVGDRVLFGKYAGTEISLEGEELLVMHETDIMAVLE